MLDRLIRAFLVIGGVSAACAWTWPGVFPDGDPVAVLVRYHTPNVYAAVVVWYYVAPGVAMFIAGQFLATPPHPIQETLLGAGIDPWDPLGRDRSTMGTCRS